MCNILILVFFLYIVSWFAYFVYVCIALHISLLTNGLIGAMLPGQLV